LDTCIEKEKELHSINPPHTSYFIIATTIIAA